MKTPDNVMPNNCDAEWLAGVARTLDSLSYPTGILNLAGHWTILNRAALAFFRVSDAASVAATPADPWAGLLQPVADVISESQDTVCFIDKRTDCIYRKQSSLLYDDRDKLYGRIESILDITDFYEADERVRAMIDAAPLCTNFWNQKFENIDCNQEAVKLFDLPDKRSYLDRFVELSPERQPNGELSSVEAKRHITSAFRNGFERFEWLHQKLNGEPVPAEITLVRVKSRKGDVVLGYTRDLRSARMLTSVDDLDWLAHLFRSLPFPVGVANVSNRWLFLNRAASEFFGGKDVEDLTGSVVGPDWGGRLRRLTPDLERHGQQSEDYQYYRDDTTDTVYIRYTTQLRDNFDRLVGRVECLQDVTSLYESEEQAHALVNVIPLPCTVWDHTRTHIFCNREAALFFGAPDGPSVIEHWPELSPKHQPDGSVSMEVAKRHIEKAFAEGTNCFDWVHRTMDGTLVPCQITLFRVKQRKGNAVLGYIKPE